VSHISGSLYIVATPIGNLDDISLRTKEVLTSVDLIAAEDTRHSRIMLSRLGIKTRLISYHDHNERRQAAGLLDKIHAGLNIGLISDAGTPLINDPGYHLVSAAHEAGIKVVPIPGPCALITALSVSGLPTDRFIFEGYLPVKSAGRRKRLYDLLTETRTMIFYEAPHRVPEFIEDAIFVFGKDRLVTIARELTKIHETIHRVSLGNFQELLNSKQACLKGEFVILLQGGPCQQEHNDDIQRILKILLVTVSLKDAVDLAAKITGRKRNEVYKQAIEMKQG
jgi:16S rRNA (cytidine1402-2'-O)-methyltransferase